MKKITLAAIAVLILFSCRKNETASIENEEQHQRSCAADEVVNLQLQADPSLGLRMSQLESFTKKLIENGAVLRGGTIEIPVVVHVLYNTTEENISDAQIQSQIDVLNEDFNLRNADRSQVPSIFTGVTANVGVRFVLSQTIRKFSTKRSWAANDQMKFSQNGGSDVVDPAHKLNIWVCDLQKYLGYAYYPGITPELDGVVVWYKAFGRTGALQVPYHKGRTATHEVGHYLNLRHIWGDAACGNDLVDDTPQHNTANFGCPSYPHLSTCAGSPVEMTMNYMDYTDDPCMFMFSNGQKTRMLALFAPGGPRAGLGQ
ncbi:MAG TPA: zinc metalloprotease [Chitinophagaceae bacterium]|nr:zinc metalloprotease [Chitinophagaceae bacterium]